MAESEVVIAEAEEAIVIGPTTETEEGEWADGENTQAHQQNRTPLPRVASIVIGGEGPRRFAVAIAIDTLVDYNIVTPDNTSQIITKDKIQREPDRFNGRNDKTKVMLEDERGKRYRFTVVEEHVSLVSEPGGKYFGHLTLTAKDAKTQAKEIHRF